VKDVKLQLLITLFTLISPAIIAKPVFAQRGQIFSPVVDSDPSPPASAYELLQERQSQQEQESANQVATAPPTQTAADDRLDAIYKLLKNLQPDQTTDRSRAGVSPLPSPSPSPQFNLNRKGPNDTAAGVNASLSPASRLPDRLNLVEGTFSESLNVLGRASLGATTVSGPLTQDGTLVLDEGRAINVVGGTLYLQSMGLGEIDFVAGKMKLDREGNLTLAGDLRLAGDLQVGGSVKLGRDLSSPSLTTNIIRPLADSDLRIKLEAAEASPTGFLRPEGRLVISNRKDEERLSIDEGGDLATLGNVESENLSVRNKTGTGSLDVRRNLNVGGRAEFQSLAAQDYVRSKELILDQGLKINPSAARPGQAPGKAATVGQSEFPAGVFSFSISNSVVTRDSLIYLTPAGSLEGQSLFVRSVSPGRSFTVGLDHPLASPVPFNWLIIN
jgi:hypothetical protein